jgi:hypothetical protein
MYFRTLTFLCNFSFFRLSSTAIALYSNIIFVTCAGSIPCQYCQIGISFHIYAFLISPLLPDIFYYLPVISKFRARRPCTNADKKTTSILAALCVPTNWNMPLLLCYHFIIETLFCYSVSFISENMLASIVA